MFMFFRIERPTTATLRPFAIATSAACCIRWMFDAKDATRIRPVRSGISWRNASPTSRSEPVMPGPLGVRRVAEQQVDAAVAELGELADVGLQAVDGRVVELPVAGVQDAPGRGLDDDRHAVRDRVRHPDELEPERAELEPAPVRVDLAQRRRSAERPCSSSFDFTSASVSLVADDLADFELRGAAYGSAPTWSS